MAIAACAELSYWAVERPALLLRDRLWVRTGDGLPVQGTAMNG